MNHRSMALILSLWLLAPCLAAGQGSGAGAPAETPPSAATRQMYEDVEVMRRLLVGKLQSHAVLFGLAGQCTTCHGASAKGTATDAASDLSDPNAVQDGLASLALLTLMRTPGHESLQHHINKRSSPIDAEGVYLKGQGVVYTLTLPRWDNDPRTEAAKPADKPLSDWERVRQQLRGDKKESARTPSAEPSLTDVVLKVLAENGKHFGQLAENESITVAITFREADKPAPAGLSIGSDAGMSGPVPMTAPFEGMGGGGPGKGGGNAFGSGGGASGPPMGSGGDGGPMGGYPGSMGGFFSNPFGTPTPSTAHDYELLGDLHYRQGNMRGAIEAYEQGVKRATKSKELASLYQKLAAAHLAPGQGDTDESAVQKALEYLKRIKDEKNKEVKPAPEAAQPPLPGKLIITAPKKVLDQAGSGKIGFEEFKKLATVESLNFSKPEKKPEK